MRLSWIVAGAALVLAAQCGLVAAESLTAAKLGQKIGDVTFVNAAGKKIASCRSQGDEGDGGRFLVVRVPGLDELFARLDRDEKAVRRPWRDLRGRLRERVGNPGKHRQACHGLLPSASPSSATIRGMRSPPSKLKKRPKPSCSITISCCVTEAASTTHLPPGSSGTSRSSRTIWRTRSTRSLPAKPSAIRSPKPSAA